MHEKYLVITGGAGFIVSKLTKTLAKDNDVIHANLLAVEKNIIAVFNVVSGREISVNELVGSIIGMNNDYGENIEIIYDDPQLADIRYSFTDISKIKEAGFEPKYTLQKGLRITRDRFSEGMVI